MGSLNTQQSVNTSNPANLDAHLLACAQKEIDNLLPHLRGEYLIYLGAFKQRANLQKSPLKQTVHLVANSAQITTLNKSASITDIIHCYYDALPLQCDSIDVALVHHALEFAANPRATLEEVYQALAPQGQLVIIGFNPISLFGLKHYFSAKQQKTRLINSKHVLRWLEQLNFTVNTYHTFCFAPTLAKFSLVEKLGQLFRLKYGACYLIAAQKRVVAVTPIKNHALLNRLTLGMLKPSPQSNMSQTQSPQDGH